MDWAIVVVLCFAIFAKACRMDEVSAAVEAGAGAGAGACDVIPRDASKLLGGVPSGVVDSGTRVY